MDAPAKKRKTMPAMSTGPTPAAAWHMLQADARAMAEVYGKGDNDGTEPLPLSSALRQVSSYVEALKKPDDNQLAFNEDLLQEKKPPVHPIQSHDDYKSDLGASVFQIKGTCAHQVYCLLALNLNLDSSGGNRVSTMKLGDTTWKGGWAKSYKAVNIVPGREVRKHVQSMVCFPMGGQTGFQDKLMKSIRAEPGLEELYENVVEHLCKDGHIAKESLRLVQMHALFGLAAESHFGWHTDADDFGNKGKIHLSAIVQVSRGSSSMEVATKERITYEGAGFTTAFDSSLWHRSCTVERGTVKLAFFFSISGFREAAVSVKKEGKQTVKQEEEHESDEDEYEESDE